MSGTTIERKKYTPRRFAEVIGVHEDSVRRACRGEYGYKQLLADRGFGSENINGRWTILPDEKKPQPVQFDGLDLEAICKLILSYEESMACEGKRAVDQPGVFRSVRRLLLMQAIKPYFESESKSSEASSAVLAIEKRLLNTFSDAEIAQSLELRWSRDVVLSKVTDLIAGLPTLELNDRLGDHALQDLSGLLSRLQESFRIAARGGKPVKLSLEINQDGSWSTATDKESASGLERAFLDGEFSTRPLAAKETLAGLFYFAWLHDIYARIYPDLVNCDHRNSGFVTAHKHRQDFLKRCLYCGSKFTGRKQKKHCSDAHRAAYCHWFQGTPTTTGLVEVWNPDAPFNAQSRLLEKLDVRLKEILKNIA